MPKSVLAQFRTKFGDVWYGFVELMDGLMPATARLEQHAGSFLFNHTGEMPVYVEV